MPEQPPNNKTVFYWLFFSSFTFLVIKFLELFYQRPSHLEQLCELLKNRIENFSFQDYQALVKALG